MEPIEGAKAIFKYRSISTRRGRRALYDALRHSRLYWQAPTAFNDPFDCAPPVAFGRSPRERATYAKILARKQGAGVTRWQRRQTKRRITNLSVGEARDIAFRSFSRSALTCFSTDNANILMWSHYAGDHSGVCLGFQQMAGKELFVAVPVAYSDERPVADLADLRDPSHKFLQASLLTKARCWEYEQEYRMFELATAPGNRVFPRAALTTLILGARMQDRERRAIIRAARKYRPDIALFQARLDDREYRIHIDPL